MRLLSLISQRCHPYVEFVPDWNSKLQFLHGENLRLRTNSARILAGFCFHCKRDTAYDRSMISCKYYLDVLSQWCYIAEFALRKVLLLEPTSVEVEYVLVPIDPGVLPEREEQLRVYRRSRMISGVETKAWISDGIKPNTWEANAAVLATALLRPDIDVRVVRSRIADAALVRGLPLANPDEASAFVSREFDLDRARLREMLQSETVRAQLEANLAAFSSAGLTVRPSFVLSNGIGDHIVLGGQYDFGILSAAIQSLRADEAAYDLFERAQAPV